VRGILKWPLIIAAAVTVLRVIVEQAGAPDSVSNLVSVVALHLLIVPLYFAYKIGKSEIPNPYLTQLKLVAIYAVLTRMMIIPTYWLARIYSWPQTRFAGVSDSPPFTGLVLIPFGTAAFWIVASTIFGTGIGCTVIALLRRSARAGK
jgi:hypothetical protein